LIPNAQSQANSRAISAALRTSSSALVTATRRFKSTSRTITNCRTAHRRTDFGNNSSTTSSQLSAQQSAIAPCVPATRWHCPWLYRAIDSFAPTRIAHVVLSLKTRQLPHVKAPKKAGGSDTYHLQSARELEPSDLI